MLLLSDHHYHHHHYYYYFDHHHYYYYYYYYHYYYYYYYWYYYYYYYHYYFYYYHYNYISYFNCNSNYSECVTYMYLNDYKKIKKYIDLFFVGDDIFIYCSLRSSFKMLLHFETSLFETEFINNCYLTFSSSFLCLHVGVSLTVYLSICPCVHLSVSLSIYISICPTDGVNKLNYSF